MHSVESSRAPQVSCCGSKSCLTALPLALAVLLALCSCQTTQVLPEKAAADLPGGTKGTVKADASAKEIAEFLSNLEAVQVSDSERNKLNVIEAGLILRLRDQVRKEVLALHQNALTAPTYRQGFVLARDAGAVVALYPLGDDAAIISEAEDLSFRQNEVVRRLDVIRRQKYNYWAAQQVEQALESLRSKDLKEAKDRLGPVDPSLLEISVASLYSYAVGEIMAKLDRDDKASLAKTLTHASTLRRTMEDF